MSQHECQLWVGFFVAVAGRGNSGPLNKQLRIADMNIKLIFVERIMKISHLSGAVFIVLFGLLTSAAQAVNVTYDFAGNCINDCGPIGVLDTTVDVVTGTLELGLAEPTIAQTWDAAVVLAYSFTFDNFTIDNTNSTLSDSGVGNFPYTTTAFAPFSLNDGFIIATYDLDNSIALNIGVSGVNLVQGSLTQCTGTCQTIASGSWMRTSTVPVPAAAWLFSSALLGLNGVSRRSNR